MYLLDRPWFKRLGVVQEISLANRKAIMQCGTDTLPFFVFRRAITVLHGIPQLPRLLDIRVAWNIDLSFSLQNAFVSQPLGTARERQTSVPHDKLYGLLGFFGPRIRSHFRSSYEIPVTQSFKDLFMAYSKLTGCLELLAHCCPHPDMAGPSWVPNWRAYGGPKVIIFPPTTESTGMSQAHLQERTPGELEVSGHLHATVSSVFESLNDTKQDSVDEWLRKTMDDMIVTETYPTGQSARKAFALLLCKNYVRQRFPGTANAHRTRTIQAVLRLLAAPNKITDGADGSKWATFVARESRWWKRAGFFRTEHGYLARGPEDTRPGDQIVLLLGLYCPLIVRPTREGRYRIVGSCYVHGLMDNEALLGPLPEGWSIRQRFVNGRWRSQYRNARAGETTDDDPRLSPLPSVWKRGNPMPTADDPARVDLFENTDTGEFINYVPRLSVTALEQRGIMLETITLV